MILRSVIRHVRDQNWFAVALDFLIVVVGVFIGIQVANWNEGIQRQAQSDTARARLAENVRGDIQQMDDRTRFFGEALAYGEHALEAFNGNHPQDLESEWAFLLAAYQVGQIWPWSPSGQVYRELQSAGDLDLVGAPAIRQALSDYYEESAREIGVTLGTIDPYRALIRRRMPWALQTYIWESCYRWSSVSNSAAEFAEGFRYMPHCSAPDETAAIRQAADAILADQELHEYLRGRLAELTVTLRFIGNVREEAVAIVAEVGTEAAP